MHKPLNLDTMNIHRKNRIKSLREKKGWRQLDLARVLDLYQSEISAIERGERFVLALRGDEEDELD